MDPTLWETLGAVLKAPLLPLMLAVWWVRVWGRKGKKMKKPRKGGNKKDEVLLDMSKGIILDVNYKH